MAGPLEGIRILDLSRLLSGPYATMILCDLGAEVIKVERPQGGDIARGNGPFVDDVSTYFLSLNRGKKSITLDLAREEDREAFLKLADRADVVVENFVPGTMAKWGLDYSVLRQRNPAIVYAAVSGFGQNGPYATKPALDIIVQAMGGVMSIIGEPGGPPIRPGVSYGDIVAGLYAAVGIMAALEERRRSGRGQMIDVGMLDCQVAVQENAFVRYLNTGEVARAIGSRHPVATPFQAFATKDDYIVVAIRGHQWPLFCAAIDRVDLIDDPRFETGYSRTQHIEVLEPILSEAMRTRTTQEWLTAFEQMGIPCGPINTIDEVAADPQVAFREMIVEVPHPGLGKVKLTNTPLKFSRTPARVERSCPQLGEHNAEVFKTLEE